MTASTSTVCLLPDLAREDILREKKFKKKKSYQDVTGQKDFFTKSTVFTLMKKVNIVQTLNY